MRLVLASASTARLSLLRAAAIEPQVVISEVDETTATGTTSMIVSELARLKAQWVATRIPDEAEVYVLGCDSLLEFGGAPVGKPPSARAAIEQWQRMRGRSRVLRTGHHLIHLGAQTSASESTATVIHFGEPTDEEIAAYVASGEPMSVAGAFTIDGRGATWVTGIEGDPTTVIGLSLPALRRMLLQLGGSIVDLWSAPPR